MASEPSFEQVFTAMDAARDEHAAWVKQKLPSGDYMICDYHRKPKGSSAGEVIAVCQEYTREWYATEKEANERIAFLTWEAGLKAALNA